MLEKILKSNLFYFIIVLYLLITFHTLSFDGKYGSIFFHEDAYFEYIGFFSFFISFIVFFFAFWRIRKNTTVNFILKAIVLGLALLFFFGAGEEISWGQRIFGIQTPEYLSDINAQNEITVHNLYFGEFDIFTIGFDLFWLFFGVVLPFVCLNQKAQGFLSNYVPIPHWSVSTLFLLNYFYAKVAKLLYVNFYTETVVSFVQAVQEIKESNYACLFVLLAFSCYFSLQNLYIQSNN